MSKRTAYHPSIGPSRGSTPARRRPYPDHPVSARVPADESEAPTPDQIPFADARERALPSDGEADEALDVGRNEPADEIGEEEHQRHPDAQADDEHAGLAALAAEFDRRFAGGNR